MQEMLAAVGFEVALNFTDLATTRDAALEPDPGSYNMLGMRGFSNATFDPIHTLLSYQAENASPKTAGGESRYTSPEVDQWVKDYLASDSEEEKSELLRQIHAKLYEDMPSIPLYNAQRYTVYGNWVTGFEDHPNEWYTYRFNPVGVER
jgi:ABC-type transport system substrate-binding protein